MELKLTAQNTNYACRIIRLPKPYKHPNADKLQCVNYQSNIVITGLAAQEGDLYVYFPLECQIHHDYLSYTDSFQESTLNQNPTVKGFFPSSGRVKAVRLRQQPSMGYIVPIASLATWIATLQPNDSLYSDVNYLCSVLESCVDKDFDTIVLGEQETILCKKYVPNTKQKGPANTPKKDKIKRHNKVVDGQFRFHVDTENLRKNMDKVNPLDTITISYKLHGTSAVYSYINCNRKLKWYEKLLQKLGVKIEDKHYDYIYSSRSVIKNGYEYDKKDHNHYYKEDVWGIVSKEVFPCLEKGITVYGEIVGFTPEGRHIQKGYDYGCLPKNHAFYVYRITSTNVDGRVVEFTWPQVLDYCTRYNLKTPPTVHHGEALNLYERFNMGPEFTDDNQFRENLLTYLINAHTEGDCYMCTNKVPAEGIVLRIEGPQFQAYKLKSFRFLERESAQLDTEEVDIETEETITI